MMTHHMIAKFVLLGFSLFFITFCVEADSRLQTVEYDPSKVVEIYTGVGIATLIQFEEDETVKDVDKGMIGMGDAKAWSVGAKSNHILLKPTASRPETILLVVTNKRSYAFDIKLSAKKNKREPTLIIRFDYPDSREKEANALSRRNALIDKKLSKGLSNFISNNNRYMKKGDAELSPTSAEDNGLFTFMTFNNSRELPVIYKVLPDGTETLTNGHMESETGTYVIHETAAMFHLRYGNSVLAIRNDGFDPNGKLNVLGTTLPNTVRFNKGDL